MEFVNVGKHCEMHGCSMQDFLPFQCKHCKKNLCLSHRSTTMHECKKVFTDATSVDCPICQKSVKFFVGQQVDEAWTEHYLNTCTKSEPVATKIERCQASRCNTALNTSNSFQCSKCNSRTCLSHRHSEAHNCVKDAAVARTSFLQNVEQNQSHQKKNSNFSKPKPYAKKQKPSSAAENNTLKGTASRRKADEILSCPFGCNITWKHIEQLEEHIRNDHSENSEGERSVDSISRTSAVENQGNEQCPTCSMRFTDIASLINHVEENHHSSSSTTRSSGGKKDNGCTLN